MSDLLKPGQIFAERYRIDRFLAEGGFGAVYAAEQIATELAVALKVLWPHVLSSHDAVEKFKLEARVAGRVNSEHIVRVFDAGFDQVSRMPFLVMELLQGRDLSGVVEKGGPLPPALVVQYFRQCASALDKAHGFRDRDGKPAPIVHRDLKPENLFLTHREDGSPLVKILDFGIAKVLSANTKVTRDVKGTPLFMAYEQASGDPISPQTDIWALGLIGFYLLTGKSYWIAAEAPEGSMSQLFGEVLTKPLVPASLRITEQGAANSFPPGFDEWFWRCVDRDPRCRFATAGEAAASLAAAYGFPESSMSRSGPIVGLDPRVPASSQSPFPFPAHHASSPGFGVAAKTGRSETPIGAAPDRFGSRSLPALQSSQPLVDASDATRAGYGKKKGNGLLIAGVALLVLLAGGGGAVLLRGSSTTVASASAAATPTATPAGIPPALASESAPVVAPFDPSSASSVAVAPAEPTPSASSSAGVLPNAKSHTAVVLARPPVAPILPPYTPPPPPQPARTSKGELYGDR